MHRPRPIAVSVAPSTPQARSQLRLVQTTDRDQWNRFVADSRQGSVFMCCAFLDAVFEEYHLLFLQQGDEVVAGTVVAFEGGNILSSPHPYCPYLGIALAGPREGKRRHSRSLWTPKVTEAFLECLAERYQRLSFGLHHAFDDLRGLQWFRYDGPQESHFRLTLRYTGLLDLATTVDWKAYLGRIRESRRYDLRKARRGGYSLECGAYADELVELSDLTFQRQGLQLDDVEKRRLHCIATSALNLGFGELIAARNAAGNIASVGLFLFDRRTTYYLAAGTLPDARISGCNTQVLLEAIQRGRERGSKWFDVIGINSPRRGDFKTSFNAVPVPYFVATWDSPVGHDLTTRRS